MSIVNKKNIRLLSLEELTVFFESIDEKKFRAKQVYEWLWKKSANSFNDMSSLSIKLRDKLNESFFIPQMSLSEQQLSADGTIKCAFKLYDNNIVEGVLIPTETRMTACISTQVGCSLTCKFCATGKLKRKRNLTFGEIYDQVVAINKIALNRYEKPLSNIVYMGMGEPLLNYKNTIQSINKLTSPNGLNMSPKRITVSTAGIAKLIKQMADDNCKANLALSLHAANDEKRNYIMPINEQNSLKSLASAIHYYYTKTRQKITYEYIIFKGFNDEIQDAKELARFCDIAPSKVNIIEYNSIDAGEFQQADEKKVDAFKAYLEKKGVVVNIRKSRGKDIDAACGQLANKNKLVTNAPND